MDKIPTPILDSIIAEYHCVETPYLLFLLFQNEPVYSIYDVLYRCDLKFLVRNLYFKLIFDIEHELDLIKGIEAQMFEGCCRLKLFHIEIKPFYKKSFKPFKCGHK
jgi:hypothetical protein